MKTLIFTLFISFSFGFFSQKDYGFDIPWRATSNEHILDWFLDQLDSDCDSALVNMFKAIGTDTNNIHWVYTSNIPQTLTDKGQDFYSLKIYSTDNKTGKISETQKYVSNNKLENKTYLLFCRSPKPDGTIKLVLMEDY